MMPLTSDYCPSRVPASYEYRLFEVQPVNPPRVTYLYEGARFRVSPGLNARIDQVSNKPLKGMITAVTYDWTCTQWIAVTPPTGPYPLWVHESYLRVNP